MQEILYEKLPKFCTECRRLGHDAEGCEAYKEYIREQVRKAKDKKHSPSEKKQPKVVHTHFT